MYRKINRLSLRVLPKRAHTVLLQLSLSKQTRPVVWAFQPLVEADVFTLHPRQIHCSTVEMDNTYFSSFSIMFGFYPMFGFVRVFCMVSQTLTISSRSNFRLTVDFHCAADRAECNCASAWDWVFFFMWCFGIIVRFWFLSKAQYYCHIHAWLPRENNSLRWTKYQEHFSDGLIVNVVYVASLADTLFDDSDGLIVEHCFFSSNNDCLFYLHLPPCLDLSAFSCCSSEKAFFST